MKIFVSGTIAYDVILDFPGKFADHIDPKKIHALSISFLLEKLERSIGGTAANIAYNLAMLGMSVKLLGCVGRDGKEILEQYKDMSIGIQLSKISKKPTAAAYIMTDKMDNQIAGFHPGAMNEKVGLPKAGKNDWAIIAAENPKNMVKLAEHYAKRKIKYIFDPGQQSIALSKKDLITCIKGASIIIGNDYEISQLSLRGPRVSRGGRSNPNEIAALLSVARNDGLIIVRTLGPKGSEVILPNGKRTKIEIARAKKTVDPTGAGDAYRAGLITGIVKGLDLKRAAQLGATAAAFAVEKYGTQNHRFNYGILVKRHNRNFKEKIFND